MIRVRLIESYNNWYWNSATGVTIKKEDRIGIEVDENDRMVRMALDQGFLEVVSDEEFEIQKKIQENIKPEPVIEQKPIEVKISNTGLTTKNVFKEVITPENEEVMKKIKEDLNNASGNTNTSNKED